MLETVQTLTIEQFTIAFLGNQPLKERVPLQASSDNREKIKKKLASYALRENFNIFTLRAKRAHGREAPRKTLTRGSERSTENPTGAELLAKNGSRRVPECYFWSFWVGFQKKKIEIFLKAPGGGDLIVRAASHAIISETVRFSRRPSSLYL